MIVRSFGSRVRSSMLWLCVIFARLCDFMTFSAVPERKPTGITEDPVFVSCTVWIIYVLSIESLTLKRLLVDIDRALEMLTAACRLF